MSESLFQDLIEATAALSEQSLPDKGEPASGAIAALVASWAGSLAAAAADQSRAEWSDAAGARAQAQALQRRALDLAARDMEAYAKARARLQARSPAAGEDEREEVRNWQLGRVVEDAAGPPLELAACACDIAALGESIAVHAAGDVRADAVVAAMLAAAAARAGAHLVEINLVVGGDRQPAARARALAQQADDAAAKAGALD